MPPVPQATFETHGPGQAPIVVVLGGISATRHVAAHDNDPSPGWWGWLAGPGMALDTRRFRWLGIDYITRTDAPTTTADQADALAAVLDRLRVERVATILGASYGGMVALSFAAGHPGRLDRLVLISAAHESHPMATAIRVIQRRIVELTRSAGDGREGLALARALAMTTYRTAREFAGRFKSAPDERGRFPVESYLDHMGSRYADVTPPERFLALSESVDRHKVEPEDIRTPATLIAVDSDTLVPPWQMRELADRMSGPSYLIEISSLYGHDAFLKEKDLLIPIIAGALTGGGDDA